MLCLDEQSNGYQTHPADNMAYPRPLVEEDQAAPGAGEEAGHAGPPRCSIFRCRNQPPTS